MPIIAEKIVEARKQKPQVSEKVLEVDKKPTEKKIGIYPQRFYTGEKHCASDRIRAEWVIKASDKFEYYREGNDYEAVIFHKAVDEIERYKGGIKLLDICDDVWKKDSTFFKKIKSVDAIIVSTPGLKEELKKHTDKEIFIIGDGHYLEHYKTRAENKHTKQAKEVVWFGYAQNSHCLAPFFKTIKQRKLKLKAVSQCQLPPLNNADIFVKWDIDTYIEEISKADFAILPVNGKLKSNNKDITAILAGIPVAKTEADIIRLLNPRERQGDMQKYQQIVKKYDVKNYANEYLRVIAKLKHNVRLYTAICGGYEKVRDDITVFTDSQSDKFKDPVMNAKIYKVLSHKFFSSEISVWMDGNVFPDCEMEDFVKMLGDADIALFRHPHRKCLYQEYPEAKLRITDQNQKILIDKQVTDYRREGMPEGFGLAECGMIIRRNNSIVEEFNNRWWTEITAYCQRDQMSFPYVWWKMKDRIKIKFIEGNVRNHKFFKYENHKRS